MVVKYAGTFQTAEINETLPCIQKHIIEQKIPAQVNEQGLYIRLKPFA